MITINQGMNGGWYGSVEAEDVDTARELARELALALADLRDATPKAVKPSTAARQGELPLTPKGSAALAYLREHPKALYEEYVAEGHSQRTVMWLVKNGFLRWNPVGTSWTVLHEG